jgi:hypothetical protein
MPVRPTEMAEFLAEHPAGEIGGLAENIDEFNLPIPAEDPFYPDEIEEVLVPPSVNGTIEEYALGDSQAPPLATEAMFIPPETREEFYMTTNGGYYDPVGVGYPEVTLASSPAAGGIRIVIGLASGVGSQLARLPVVGPIVQRLVGQGVRTWNSLPAVLQVALTYLGVTKGADILFDTGFDDGGLFPVTPEALRELQGRLGGGAPSRNGTGRLSTQYDPEAVHNALHTEIASAWEANGVWFYRLTNGRLAVRNKHGVVKSWRPKKPIVLYRSGNRDMRDIFRADAVISKVARKMAKLLRRQGYKVARN